MHSRTFCAPVTALTILVSLFLSGGSAHAQEFVPLWNGRDLTGWTNVNCAPETFTVRDGMIVSTGVPTGVLRTTRMYENFVAELEWKHLKKDGNAGFFIHSGPLPICGQPFTKAIEIQIIDGNSPEGLWTGHGDVFSIQGATMTPTRPHPRGWMRSLPSERRAHPVGEWNHYRVESRDGRVTLAVNGKVVSGGSNCVPRRGYLCLEAEGSECHFRNLRIQELPPSVPPPPAKEIAEVDQGFVSLYNGLDLRGWKQAAGHVGHWKAKDWILDYDGKSTAEDKNLWTAKSFRDFQLIVDWRFTNPPQKKNVPVILPNGDYAKNDDGSRKMVEVPDGGDSGIYLRGSDRAQVNIWCWPIGSGEFYGYRDDAQTPAVIRAGLTPRVKADKPIGQWNRFIITLRGDRVTVVLNDQTVIENARLSDLPVEGPIALQHRGDAIQFANLYVREL